MLSILHGLREVWWVIAVPFVVGIVLTTLRAVASQQAFENDTSIDAALDMTFLALGAVGGVLSRPKISQEMAGYLAEFIGAVLLIMV